MDVLQKDMDSCSHETSTTRKAASRRFSV